MPVAEVVRSCQSRPIAEATPSNEPQRCHARIATRSLQPAPRVTVTSHVRPSSLPLLLLATLSLSACDSAEDIGQRAGLEYIAPFLGVAEARTSGCDEQLEVGKQMFDLGTAKRAELEPKVEKVKGDEEFEKALTELTDRVKGDTITRFAEQCPEQAAEFAKIVQQTADELGLADVVPAWPPAG